MIEANKKSKIVWRYKVQFQSEDCKNGWLDCHCNSCIRADENPSHYDLNIVYGEYKKSQATMDHSMSCVDKHAKIDIPCTTRIKRIGHLI